MKIELENEQIQQIAEIVAAMVAKKLMPQRQAKAMSIRDVAAYINKSVESVRIYMRKDKSFPIGRKIGHEYRFDKSEVERWFNVFKRRESSIVFNLEA